MLEHLPGAPAALETGRSRTLGGNAIPQGHGLRPAGGQRPSSIPFFTSGRRAWRNFSDFSGGAFRWGAFAAPPTPERTTPGDPAWQLENTFRLVNIALNVEHL